MRSLINFIFKYSYTILFIIFEIVCFIFIFSGNPYQRVSFFNSTNSLSGITLEKWNNMTDYFYLKKTNESLAIENEILRNNLEKYRSEQIPSIDKSGFNYISAKLISASVNKKNNFLTINKGRKHGIKNEMAVICSEGVVGIIVSVSENFASVMPIINTDFSLSVKIEKNNYFGSLKWDGNSTSEANLSEIPSYVSVNKGDKIVTSGFSTIFPEKIPVGFVKEINTNSANKFYTLKVELFSDFRNLNYVYVIQNNFSNEINSLIQENKSDKK